MQEYQLKELIGLPKLNYGNLKRVYDYLQENPGTNTLQLGTALGIGHGVYRYRDLLFAHKLINKYNVPTKIEEKRSRLTEYVFPADVLNGNNSLNLNYVNLAATLARFNDSDLVPGFTLTKAQILEKINYNFTEITSTAAYLKQIKDSMLQDLAILALVANQLTAFKDITNSKPVKQEDFKELS